MSSGKMKILVLMPVLLVMLFGNAVAQDAMEEQRDLDRERIVRSAIKVEEATTYRYVSGAMQEPGQPLFTYRYDTSGNKTGEIAYDAQGSVLKDVRLTYAGELVTEAVAYDVGGAVITTGTFRYDPDGNVVSQVTNKSDGSVLMEIAYQYDTGNVVETNISAGTHSRRIVHTRDANGDIVETVSYAGDGSVSKQVRYQYDAAGRVLEKTSLDAAGQIQSTMLNVYDGAGKLVEIRTSTASGDVISIISTVYDGEGRLAERTHTMPAAEHVTRVTFQYDDKGNRASDTTYNKLGDVTSVTQYAYEFYRQQ